MSVLTSERVGVQSGTPKERKSSGPILIRKVAVLGAGNMGSRIAAHLANAGVPVVLLDMVRDIVPERSAADKGSRNAVATAGRGGAEKCEAGRVF